MPVIRCHVDVTYINKRDNTEISWASRNGDMYENIHRLLEEGNSGREIKSAVIEQKETE